MVKISIIMPVYNCEAYLQESLDSVLHQTIYEWELLCVDDGSTDSSLEILGEYQSRDSRIHVFTQSNQGAGVARNLGIQHAEGEYIAFLDADDYYLDTDALEKMYEACNKYKVDACGSTIKLLRNGILAEDHNFQSVQQVAKDKNVLDYRDFQFDYGYCGFIFKTDVLKINGIVFPMYRRFQDPPFLVKAMLKIGRFCFLDKLLYCYRTPNVSVRFNSVKARDLLRGLLDNLEFATSNNLDILFERTLKRLEVEYSNIICHNLSTDSTEVLELLLKANQLVRKVTQKEDYMVAPLQKILESVSKAEKLHRENLRKKMIASKRIYLYGAGSAATDCLLSLQNLGLFEKIIAIVVTSTEGNPKEIKGIPVVSVDNYQYAKGDLVLITVTNIHSKDIVSKLQDLQVEEYEVVDIGMLRE